MAAADVGGGAGTLHVAPVRRDSEDRVVWRYVIEDATHRELVRGEDLRSGSGDEVDPAKAMETLVSFLAAAAEAYRASMSGRASEHAELFPEPVMEWAYVHDDDLASVAVELEELHAEEAGKPHLRAVGDNGPLPAGWTVEPVGQWNGRDAEAVFDPRRHDVRVVQSAETEDREGELAAAGWAYEGTDGYAVLWVRDRVAAARAALDRAPPDPPDLGGLGR
jgi:hypothetical protein